MLKIRPEQLKAFEPVAEAAFTKRVVEYLRKNHAEVEVRLADGILAVGQVSDEVMFKLVRNGIARARRHEIAWESNLTAFVVLMFVSAPNFDEHPLIARVLNNDDVPPESRMDQLWEQTTEANWEAVEQAYSPAAWETGVPERKE